MFGIIFKVSLTFFNLYQLEEILYCRKTVSLLSLWAAGVRRRIFLNADKNKLDCDFWKSESSAPVKVLAEFQSAVKNPIDPQQIKGRNLGVTVSQGIDILTNCLFKHVPVNIDSSRLLDGQKKQTRDKREDKCMCVPQG